MQMLFDNDNYVVVHQVLNPEANMWVEDHCFEIIDKAANKEVFLRGSWAEAFRRQIQQWQANVPAEADVEIVLQGFCVLAQIPLVVH